MKPLSNPKKERASSLVAAGRLEYREIAEKVGVTQVTLYRWRQEPKFVARVSYHVSEISAGVKIAAVASKNHRLAVLNQLQTKLLNLMEQRAADPATVDAAGGDQGLIVRQYKVSGETTVTEFAFDRAVLQELRAVQEQAAKELGQLVNKHEHKITSFKDLSDDELAALAADPDDGAEVEGESSSGDCETEAA